MPPKVQPNPEVTMLVSLCPSDLQSANMPNCLYQYVHCSCYTEMCADFAKVSDGVDHEGGLK